MLASVGTEIPEGGDWTFEPKYDGIRVLVYATPASARLVTRNGKDKTAQFPGIAEAVRKVAGIRLGRCTEVPANDPDFGETEEEVFRFWCTRSAIPYLGRADIGHDADNKVVIDASSLSADNDRLTGHLKSPDFFGVAQFPTAVFVSTSVALNATNSTVTGNLTLHGVTKEISFPAKIDVSGNAVTVAAQFVINRLDFGIAYKGMPNDLIRKEVVLKLNVNATPGKADFESVVKAAQAGAGAIPAMAARPGPGGARPAPGTAPTRPGGQQRRPLAR